MFHKHGDVTTMGTQDHQKPSQNQKPGQQSQNPSQKPGQQQGGTTKPHGDAGHKSK